MYSVKLWFQCHNSVSAIFRRLSWGPREVHVFEPVIGNTIQMAQQIAPLGKLLLTPFTARRLEFPRYSL